MGSYGSDFPAIRLDSFLCWAYPQKVIAKRITSKAAKPRMARLVKYIVDAEGKLDPRSWERTADYILCSKTNKYGEKVGGVRVTNCHTDDPAAATTLIEATQAANTSSETDKTYHLMFSFPPGEEPPLDVLHKLEDELVASIGFSDHQRISAVHIDKKHLHVHVAINKVRKVGKNYNNISPSWDKRKLMEACERLEIEYDLTRTNHGLDGREPKVKAKEKQAQAEAHSGIESLQGHITREMAPKLKEAKTWQEAHMILAKHGLQIKKRGAGLVIGNGEIWVKASQCDRALSLKALSDRLGPMEQSVHPASTAYPLQAKRTPYEPKPIQKHPSSAALYERYQAERQAYQLKREHGLEQIKYEGALLEYNLKKWNRAQRLIVKAGFKGPARRLMLKTIQLQTQGKRNKNHKKIDARKKQFLASGSCFPSWSMWLAQSAINGNEESLAVLRSRQEREYLTGNRLSAPAAPAHFVVPNLNPSIDRNGHVFYKTHDGGLVIDRSNHVQCFRTTTGAAQFALELAAKRFNGQALIVEGSEDFKKEVARLANIRSVNVRFADPAMEKIRNPKHKPLEAEI